MNDALVLTEIDPSGFAVLTLNRPQAMNALSRELWRAGADHRRAAADPAVRVLILTGAGKAFCAGLDLKELGGGQASVGGRDGAVTANDPVSALQRFTGPVIGAINGAAVTGGFELALACDVLIASSPRPALPTRTRASASRRAGGCQPEAQPRAIGIYRATRDLAYRQLGQRRAGRGLGLRQPRRAGRGPAADAARKLARRHAQLRARDAARATRRSSTTASRCLSATACSSRRRAASRSTPGWAPRLSRHGAKRCARATAADYAAAAAARRSAAGRRCRR